MTENPPYTITSHILALAERIGEAIGRTEEAALSTDLRLRRLNRIRTIRGSLAIEGNTLTEEQVSTILDGKPVVAPLREIQEVRNAINAYDQYLRWDPARETDLLKAHEVLMVGLLDAPGHYRPGGVAVTGAGEVHHIGPPADRVSHLMSDLLLWLGSTTDHPLITSSVFHYEFEFIHPFEDGNGRMGRLWQTLILTRWKPLFADVPVESLSHARQDEYYEAIRASSAKGESTPFIAFMLGDHYRGHPGYPDERPSRRPSKRPSSTAARRPAGRCEVCDRTYGKSETVASPHFPQQLHSTSALRWAGGNDPS